MSEQTPAPPLNDAGPAPSARPTTSPALLFLAWAVVGVPAAWGVSKTFQTSLGLFRAPPPAATTAPASSPTSAPTPT